MPTILDRFLADEANDDVRGLLREALHDLSVPLRRFELNLFEVTIDHEARSVVIDDVLDATEAGTIIIPIAELASAIKKTAALPR